MDKRDGILIISVTIFVLSFVGTASAMNWSVDCSGGADFIGIQDAINNASAGDTIIVHSGVYYENLVINKSVTLKGNGQPVVDAGGKGDAIRLTADGITLEGFTVTNSESFRCCAGITVISSNNTITGNNVGSNRVGIVLYESSNNNIITGNKACRNSDGICITYSGNNIISGNNVCNNSGGGISLPFYNSNNNIYLNNFINNTDNVYSYESTNIWNLPSGITYTYNGTTYESYLGNYWDDYEGTDADGDGIGNTPYSIDSKEDESDDYPLMMHFENYFT